MYNQTVLIVKAVCFVVKTCIASPVLTLVGSVLYNSVSLIGAYGLVNSRYLTFVVLQKKSNSSILSALKYEKLYFHKLSVLKFTQKRFILSNTELKAHNMYALANMLVYDLQIIYVVKLVILHCYFSLYTNSQSHQ